MDKKIIYKYSTENEGNSLLKVVLPEDYFENQGQFLDCLPKIIEIGAAYFEQRNLKEGALEIELRDKK